MFGFFLIQIVFDDLKRLPSVHAVISCISKPLSDFFCEFLLNTVKIRSDPILEILVGTQLMVKSCHSLGTVVLLRIFFHDFFKLTIFRLLSYIFLPSCRIIFKQLLHNKIPPDGTELGKSIDLLCGYVIFVIRRQLLPNL